MSDPSLQRFPCPHCKKVLKTRSDWAGRSAHCPACGQHFTVPEVDAAPVSSRLARQFSELVSADDDAVLDDAAADDFALCLSQGTCRDYDLADKLRDRRSLPARQWRRLLASAAAQENLRLKVEAAVAEDFPLTDDATPIPLLAAGENTAPNAWTILARYLYFLTHATCDHCRDDPTGMACLYLSFEAFLAARRITGDRAAGWHAAIRQHLGI